MTKYAPSGRVQEDNNLVHASKACGQVLQRFLLKEKKSDKIVGNITRMMEILVYL